MPSEYVSLCANRDAQIACPDSALCVTAEVTGIGDIGVEGPLNFTATTHLKELPGGDGGKVLSLTILQVLDQPTLMTWTVTTANFAGGRLVHLLYGIAICCACLVRGFFGRRGVDYVLLVMGIHVVVFWVGPALQ